MRKKIFWGLLLIAAAVFLIISQLGLITATLGVWSIVLGILFAGILLDSLIDRNFFGIFFSIAFLWVIFDEPLGFEKISYWTIFIAAALLTIGFSILFPKFHKKANKKDKWNDNPKWEAYEDPNKVGEHQTVIDEENEGNIYCSNHFGATTKYINTPDLRSATLEGSFGEMKVYFDGASVMHSPAVIDVNVSFGEMELYLPREWNVINTVSATLGAVNEKNKNQTTGMPEVRLKGNVSFGELAIIYV